MRILFFLFLFTSSVPAFAGTIGFTSIDTFTNWESDCSKPDRPSFSVYDVASYNLAVEEFNSYLYEVERYVQCVQNEAQEDSTHLANAIEEGTEKAIDSVSSELDSARFELENSKLFIN